MPLLSRPAAAMVGWHDMLVQWRFYTFLYPSQSSVNSLATSIYGLSYDDALLSLEIFQNSKVEKP